MHSDAISPGKQISSVIRELKRVNKKVDSEVSLEDQALADLVQMPGWGQLKVYLEARIESLKDLSRGKIDKDSLETIGLKAIISDMAQDELRNVISKVEQTGKAIEEHDRKNKEGLSN